MLSKNRRFHVIKDEGEKIVLQSQKGTVSNIAWNEKNNVKEGPTTALEALEKETKDWTNVNNLEYSIGDDNSTLGYSRCSSANWCHTGGYSLNKSSIHARMITVQELKTLNCVNSTSDNKCPVWVFNYLSKSNEKNNKIFGGIFCSICYGIMLQCHCFCTGEDGLQYSGRWFDQLCRLSFQCGNPRGCGYDWQRRI